MQTTSRNYQAYYVAKNWALAMMLKAFPLVHFWSVLLLKEQMTTSVRKTLKTLVWSAQNRSISSEICPENNHKIRRFLTDLAFWPSLLQKFPRNWPIFPRFCPKTPAKFNFFFRDLSEALHCGQDLSVSIALLLLWVKVTRLIIVWH